MKATLVGLLLVLGVILTQVDTIIPTVLVLLLLIGCAILLGMALEATPEPESETR